MVEQASIMRRTAILFLCSLGPAGATASCFSDDSSQPPDAGLSLPDGFALPPVDSTAPSAEGSTPEASPPEVTDAAADVLEAETVSDASPDVSDDSPDVLDAAEDAFEAALAPDASDAPIDAPPVGNFPTSVDFGLVDCASPPATKTYSFTNTGPVGVTYSANVRAGSAFAIQGAASGSVAPGATGSITLAATVPASATAGTPIADTLTLATNVPGSTSVAVALRVTPQGGSLTVTPTPASFGAVQLTALAADIPLTIKNVGNAALSLTVGAPTDGEFGVKYTGAPAAASLGPDATLAGAAATFQPRTAGTKMATADLRATGALCASATQISMTGSGTTAPVTVSPSPVDFGTVACGSAGTRAPVTITNGYAFAVTYSASLGRGTASPFTLDSTSGTVSGNGQATIHVTPSPIAVPASTIPGAFDDTLTITTNAPSVAPFTIPVNESASGAVLTVSMPTTDFGDVPPNTTPLTFTVTNKGNVDAPLKATAAGAGFAAALTGNTTAAANGGTSPGQVTFTPLARGMVKGSLTVSTTANLCSAPPAAIQLSATGTGPVAGTTTMAVAFTGANSVSCGGGASGTQTVTISNSGDASLVVSGIASKGGTFTASPSTLTIAPGSSGDITLQVPAPVKNANGAYDVSGGTSTDALVYSTNEFGPHSYSIPVTVTVNGANLQFVDAAGNPLALPLQNNLCPSSGSHVGYGVYNSGNVTVGIIVPAPYPQEPVQFTQSENFGGAFKTATAVMAGQKVFDTVNTHYSNLYTTISNTCVATDSVAFTMTRVGNSFPPVCQPLPALTIDDTITFDANGSCNYCC
jgi:hypothetical protein